MHVKRGSRVLTTLVKATVPYAGATVDITCPSASHSATLLTVASWDHERRGGSRSEANRFLRMPRVGRGIHSAPTKSEPMSSCTAEDVTGKFQIVRISLFSTEYTIDMRYQPANASGTLIDSYTSAAAFWPPRKRSAVAASAGIRSSSSPGCSCSAAIPVGENGE